VVMNSMRSACKYNPSDMYTLVLTFIERLGLSHADGRVQFAKVMSFARCRSPGMTACTQHLRRGRLDIRLAKTMSRHKRLKRALSLLQPHDLSPCPGQRHPTYPTLTTTLRPAGPETMRGGVLEISRVRGEPNLVIRYESWLRLFLRSYGEGSTLSEESSAVRHLKTSIGIDSHCL
jgi:hypothetical protein